MAPTWGLHRAMEWCKVGGTNQQRKVPFRLVFCSQSKGVWSVNEGEDSAQVSCVGQDI
jgi:hypothetical protein